MYTIIIKGEAKTSCENLSLVDGISCNDNFADYFDRDVTYKNNINSGYMHFEVEKDKLYSITEYYSDRELTNDEIKDLSEYTQGQWSDGIGEGFEQQPCAYDEEGNGVYISPWFWGQELVTSQNKI